MIIVDKLAESLRRRWLDLLHILRFKICLFSSVWGLGLRVEGFKNRIWGTGFGLKPEGVPSVSTTTSLTPWQYANQTSPEASVNGNMFASRGKHNGGKRNPGEQEVGRQSVFTT